MKIRELWFQMGKKKVEHVVFDQMRKQKKSIPFSMVNKEWFNNQRRKSMIGAKENESKSSFYRWFTL